MFFTYSTHPDIKKIQKGLLQFFIQCIVAAIAYLVIRTDIIVLKNGLSENSLTEYYQQFLLLVVIISFTYIAVVNKQARAFATLIIGFFSCMFIRESDGVLDKVYHGFWLVPALIVAFTCLFLAFKNRKGLLSTSARFFDSRYFYTLSCALVIILVFSRLAGMNYLWQTLLDGHYIRTIKNLAEEGTELLGYSLLAYSALGFGIEVHRLKMSE
ncbi:MULTISPECIES: hypothetical protein [Aliivibrio]|uniref:Uncharacterized protein n=1 Tax=Aliivibrio finisterrensis TaxID=511998 RepID=A0A4Q5KWX6_9GAMM|nr:MULTISPECIES: hypothetical protein [Aliivibrio]MDD9178153.1 hypothetical protein [Aliivibrio sp. A6]RYU53569.1 hypothetical protein ERW57_03175 [Aliivibrio finisterrensis]RYU54233.1 hypothetical protein ERW56_06450 [Aliivibrio finisterrensis]RYU59213.1 hypothetical protein ERW50_05865 [Aliivibrio finisterrensis]RYU62603.1 hypothetical protein ERW53_16005 [Aliivibrio finisterrensis]